MKLHCTKVYIKEPKYMSAVGVIFLSKILDVLIYIFSKL